jgi:hypothetical protein
MKRLAFAAAVFALSVAGAASVQAALVPIAGNTAASTEGLGNFSGSLDYVATNATTATLTVELTNTSAVANGGFITAFVLNNPGNLITSVTLSTATGVDTLLGLGNNNIGAAPFGQFDFGASSGGGFEGGGNPNVGVGVGVTGTWTFTFAGSNLDTLTTQSFLNELSVGPGIGGGPQFMVVRFRGFNDGGSDKVPAVPVPAAVPLFLSGLAAVTFLARRKAS